MSRENDIDREFKDYEDRISRLKRVEKKLRDLGSAKWRIGHGQDITGIEAILKEPNRVDEAERLLAVLQDQLKKEVTHPSTLTPPSPPKEDIPAEQKPLPYFPQELYSRYSAVEFIARGGFARVYKVMRSKDQAQVAVKIPIDMNPDVGKSFITEIENWRKLDHENIARLLDFNILPTIYLEMELCTGSLADVIKPLMVERAAFILLEISRGLNHAHKKKIFHTDLKPSNILLLNDVPKITDWGLSKVQSEDGDGSPGSFSPQYAAPEQCSQNIFGNEDERTDIFQMGTIFYQLVTGELPFHGDNLSKIENDIIAQPPKPPSELNPEAIDVEPFILKCLQKKKQDRYQNLSEFQDDLADFLGVDFEKSMTLSRNKIEQLKLCSDLVEVFAVQKNTQKCLIYLNNLHAYALTRELKEMIKEEIDALEFYSSVDVDIGERIPRLEKVIHHARMGE